MVDHEDKERYRASMSRLEEILKGISVTADQVATWRCPYKNAKDRCTAGFGCHNQDRTVQPGELFVCTGNDRLDYRVAWET